MPEFHSLAISQRHHFRFRPWGFPSVIIMEFHKGGEFWQFWLRSLALYYTEKSQAAR